MAIAAPVFYLHDRRAQAEPSVVSVSFVRRSSDRATKSPHQIRVAVLAAFAALIAFGCVLRFWKLTGVGLWYDELYNVVGAANRSLTEIFSQWVIGDSHPPGYLLFYFAWLKVFPATELWSRLPNAIAGTLTIAYLLFGTRRILNDDERIITAAFASLSSVVIFYSLSVKQYSPMILLATIATTTYLNIIVRGGVDRRSATTLCLSSIALAYLNHFGLVYAAILLALLGATFRRDPEHRRTILGIAAVAAIAYLPIAYFLYLQVVYSICDWQPYDIRTFVSELFPGVFYDDATYLSRVLIVLFGSAGIVLLARRQFGVLLQSRRNRHLFLIASVFGAFMLALGVSKPIFYVRYFLVTLPVLFIAMGVVIAAAFPLRSWLVIVPLLFFARAAWVDFHTVDTLQRQEWDRSVDLVLSEKRPGDAVLVLGASPNKTAFEYLRERNVDGLFYVRNVKFYEYYFDRRGAYDTASQLRVVEPSVESARELASGYQRSGRTVYVLAGHHIQYDPESLATLEESARSVDVTTLYSTLVYKLTF